MLLIQCRDIYAKTNYNILYFPSKSLSILYKQSTAGYASIPFAKTLIYSGGKVCFIGYNQLFSDYLTKSQPSSYLFCTVLKSDYTPNTYDTRSCWTAESSSDAIYINTAGKNDITLYNMTNTSYAIGNLTAGDVFT